MEYLMTYGWAILVIVIVLAALIYMGTFNLATKSPDTCNFQVGLHCQSWRLDASDDNVTIHIINGYQQYINVTQVLCQTQGTTGVWTTYPQPVEIAPQRDAWLTIDHCYDNNGAQINFEQGEMFTGKAMVQFYFRNEGLGMPRRNTADVKFTAQP